MSKREETAGAGAGAGAGADSDDGESAPPKRVFDSALVTHITGEKPADFHKITEFEMIFTRCHVLQDLEMLPSLRSLTMIDSNLKRISGLQPVAHSLVRLVLTEQLITTMEGLNLPNLRDLQLHNNAITRIQGLEGCPRLQRLWLFNNKISVIENLDAVGGLRELWLQDNRISRITGVEHLVNLQVLMLGANRIADLNDLHKLEGLPALRSLSFDDVNFGGCPVISMEGYRSYVVCSLPQLSQLDADDITPRERKSAHDGYLQKALDFSKRMSDLASENDRELLAIEARRQRNWLTSGAMRGELLATFGELEVVVREGRAAVAVEQARQQHVRETNLAALNEELETLRREQAAWVDRRLEEEKRAMEVEDAAFTALLVRAEAEAEEAAHVAALTYRTRGAVVCQELSEHSPDFRFLLAHINDVMATQPGTSQRPSSRSGRAPKPSRPLRMLKAYKVFNRALERQFVTAGDSTETLRLYVSGDRAWLRQVLEKGFTGGDSAPLVLFEDPWHAVAKAVDREPAGRRRGGTVHGLLQCRVCPGTTLELPGAGRRLPDDEAIKKVAARIPSGYTAACMSAEGGNDESGDEGKGEDGGAACYVMRQSQSARVLPEFFLLASEIGPDDVVKRLGAVGNAARGVDSNEAALELALADLTKPVTDVATGLDGKVDTSSASALIGGVDSEGVALLASFQAKVAAAVASHEQRVWREMDPSTARELAKAEQDVRRLTQHLNSLREEIDNEKGLQERILREFRQQLGRAKGSTGGGSKRGGSYFR